MMKFLAKDANYSKLLQFRAELFIPSHATYAYVAFDNSEFFSYLKLQKTYCAAEPALFYWI
jgi:hypothetical protein